MIQTKKNPFQQLVKKQKYLTIKNWKLFQQQNKIFVEQYENNYDSDLHSDSYSDSIIKSEPEFEVCIDKCWFDGPNETWYFTNPSGNLFKLDFSDRFDLSENICTLQLKFFLPRQ